MGPSAKTSFAAISLLCIASAGAVSLSDLPPALANVPGACGNIYTAHIDGCTVADFPYSCSAGCVRGLVRIEGALNDACSDVSVPRRSLIAAFREGVGIRALCNVVVVTGGSDLSSPTASPNTSSTRPSLVHPGSSTRGISTSSSTVIIKSPTSSMAPTTTHSSSASSTSTCSATKISLPSSPPSSSSSSTARTKPTQASGNDGTGGDPFSITDSNSPATSILPSMIFLGATVLLGLVSHSSSFFV